MKLSYVMTVSSWMNKEIKELIEQKNQFYIRFIRSNKALFYISQLKVLQDELDFLTEKSESYYSKQMFADGTYLFSVVHDVTISFFELNSDLAKISEWAFK